MAQNTLASKSPTASVYISNYQFLKQTRNPKPISKSENCNGNSFGPIPPRWPQQWRWIRLPVALLSSTDFFLLAYLWLPLIGPRQDPDFPWRPQARGSSRFVLVNPAQRGLEPRDRWVWRNPNRPPYRRLRSHRHLQLIFWHCAVALR